MQHDKILKIQHVANNIDAISNTFFLYKLKCDNDVFMLPTEHVTMKWQNIVKIFLKEVEIVSSLQHS